MPKDFDPLLRTEKVKPVKKGSRLAIMIEKMQDGATLQELADAMNYPIQKIWRDHAFSLQRKGYGRVQEGDKFFLVLPEGVEEPLIK